MKDAVAGDIVMRAFGGGNGGSGEVSCNLRTRNKCRTEVMQFDGVNREVRDCNHFGTIQAQQSPL
jgi:hypothetical protein